MGKRRNQGPVSRQACAWQHFVTQYGAEISADLVDGLSRVQAENFCVLTWASATPAWCLFDCVALWLYIYERNQSQGLQAFHALLQERYMQAKGLFPKKSKYYQQPFCDQPNLILLFMSYANTELLNIFASNVDTLNVLHEDICFEFIPAQRIGTSLASCSFYTYCMCRGHSSLTQAVAAIVRANQHAQDQAGRSMAQLAVVHRDDVAVDFMINQFSPEVLFETGTGGVSALSLAFVYGNDFALKKMFSMFQNASFLRQALVGNRQGISSAMQAFFQSKQLYTCEMTTFLFNRMQEEKLCNDQMMQAFMRVVVRCLSDKSVITQEKHTQDKLGYIDLFMRISQQLTVLDPMPIPSGMPALQISKHNAIRQQVLEQLAARQAELALPECLVLDDMPLGVTMKYIDVLGGAYCRLVQHLFAQNRSKALLDWLKMYRRFSRCSYVFSAFLGVPSSQRVPLCYPDVSIVFAWLTQYVVAQPRWSIAEIRWYLLKQTIAFLQQQGQVSVSTGEAWLLVVKTLLRDDFFSADSCEERKESTVQVFRYLLQHYASPERIETLHRAGFFYEVSKDTVFWRFMMHGDLDKEVRLRLIDWLLWLLEKGDAELLTSMHVAYAQAIETQQAIRDDAENVIETMEIIREHLEKTIKEPITMKPYKACKESDTDTERVVRQTHDALISMQNKVLEDVVRKHEAEMKEKDDAMLRMQQEIETLKASFTVMVNDRSQPESTKVAKNNAKLHKQLQAAQKELRQKDEQLAEKECLLCKNQKTLEDMQERLKKTISDSYRLSMHAEMLRYELRAYEMCSDPLSGEEARAFYKDDLGTGLNDQDKTSSLEEECRRLRRKDRVRRKAFASFVNEWCPDESGRYLGTNFFAALPSVAGIQIKK